MSGMRPKPGIKLKITNMREDPNNEGVAGKCYIDVSVQIHAGRAVKILPPSMHRGFLE